MSEAEKAVERIVREKTSPGRKRVYRVRTIAGETRNCEEGKSHGARRKQAELDHV